MVVLEASKLSGNGSDDNHNDGEVDVVTKTKPKTKKPSMYSTGPTAESSPSI